ncbi:MAG: DUF1385 domain-containing protein [Eubacteriales bacterium]|nr:DUF1385 domain-containing protein [Eubacteriales bacterium]MDD4390494.1 DUF1385 domain-containing protein [Eubacteriales bacterium]
MDLKRIFMKDACPTKIGGQAILEGIMMRGSDRTATVIRLPDKSLYISTEKLKPASKWSKVPLIRGVVAFVGSLVMGTRILMKSADILEKYEGETEDVEDDKLTLWLEKKFGKEGAWNAMMYASVVIALLFTVGVFILLPTVIVNWCKYFTSDPNVLNLIEGVLRIAMFVIYVALIRKMPDIRRVFQFHGAEHKCIHCYEKGLPLTVENCRPFYTLHPRCGTSFLMFVLVISFLLHAFLGWPSLGLRIASRLLLLPVVAGVSYELLRWAGRSDNLLVKILSLPGLYLQKLTTVEPDDEQLQVSITAMKAVLVPEDTPVYEGLCDCAPNAVCETE